MSGITKPILIAPLQHYSYHYQNQACNLHRDQADNCEPPELAFVKGGIQWGKYGDQYADFTNSLTNQLSSRAQALPFGIFGAEGALLKMPNVTSYRSGHTFTPKLS